MPKWTSEMHVMMLEAFRDGCTCGGAAMRISKATGVEITRNAVIGRHHRSNAEEKALLTHKPGIPQSRPRGQKPKPKREHKPRARLRYNIKERSFPLSPMKIPERQPTYESPTACTIFDLRGGVCRWPLWASQTPFEAQTYCGAGTGGPTYCPTHHAASKREPLLSFTATKVPSKVQSNR